MGAWSLTQNSFENLLRHLHPNRDIAGEIYEESRRKLVRFFVNRGAELPESLADQTLDRAIKRLEGGVVVPNFVNYCFGVARLLNLEMIRKRNQEQAALRELTGISRTNSVEDDRSQEMSECLERLMDQLPEEERRLIIAYYQGREGETIENRQRLAAELGIAVNAVRIRAHRIRRKLEAGFLSEQVQVPRAGTLRYLHMQRRSSSRSQPAGIQVKPFHSLQTSAVSGNSLSSMRASRQVG